MTLTDRTNDFAFVLAAARRSGQAAVKALAEEHLPLVAAMVRRFPACGQEREELYQQGCIGLMKALARFDPDQGTAFSTYAASMILGEMRMLRRLEAPLHIPRQDRALRLRIRRMQDALSITLQREPTVQELATALRMNPAELVLQMDEVRMTSLDAPSDGSRCTADILPDRDPWMDRLLLKDLMERLPKADRKLMLLRLRYGLSQAETARILGLSQVQVSRRELAIKAGLRRAWQEE